VRQTQFRAWLDFALASARLCYEAQEVVNLRVTKLASGDLDSSAEMQLMFVEKGFALAEAVATLSSGGSMQKVIRRYRRHVRTNKRRLTCPERRK
jgi:hypothetical protein